MCRVKTMILWLVNLFLPALKQKHAKQKSFVCIFCPFMYGRICDLSTSSRPTTHPYANIVYTCIYYLTSAQVSSRLTEDHNTTIGRPTTTSLRSSKWGWRKPVAWWGQSLPRSCLAASSPTKKGCQACRCQLCSRRVTATWRCWSPSWRRRRWTAPGSWWQTSREQGAWGRGCRGALRREHAAPKTGWVLKGTVCSPSAKLFTMWVSQSPRLQKASSLLLYCSLCSDAAAVKGTCLPTLFKINK